MQKLGLKITSNIGCDVINKLTKMDKVNHNLIYLIKTERTEMCFTTNIIRHYNRLVKVKIFNVQLQRGKHFPAFPSLILVRVRQQYIYL